MHNPELVELSRVEWQLFCTLTFKSERHSDRVRLAMVFAWCRIVASLGGVHFKRLLWVLREERGESTARLHYHALIAGLPDHVVTHNRFNFHVMEKWRNVGGGHPKVTKIVDQSGAVDYVMKGGPVDAATRLAADYHEFSKFGNSCKLMLSESVVRRLSNRKRDGWRDSGTRDEGDRQFPDTERDTPIPGKSSGIASMTGR